MRPANSSAQLLPVAPQRRTKPAAPSLPPVVPVKFVKMAALNTATNLATATDQRIKAEVQGRVESWKALQAYLEEADSVIDPQVEAIRWPTEVKGAHWGTEKGMGTFVKRITEQIKEEAEIDRCLVVCGSSNAIVPTSAGQVRSKDHCADVVLLFPGASTPGKVRSWERVDTVWDALALATDSTLIDERNVDDVLVFGEVKANPDKKVEVRDQAYRRFYRATSTKPIRKWVFAFTLCGSKLRVYIHTPSGIVRSESIDCASESGLASLKRLIVRFLRHDLDTLGAIAYAALFPCEFNMGRLPPQGFPPVPPISRPPSIKLLCRQLVHPAMFGARPSVYRIELDETMSDLCRATQPTFVSDRQPTPLPQHTMRIANPDRDEIQRTQRLDGLVRLSRSTRPDDVRSIAIRKIAFVDIDNFWTVPPPIGRSGDTNFVPRTLQCDVFEDLYRTVLEIESTSAMVDFNIGIVEGLRFLCEHGLLPRQFSDGSLMINRAGQGVLVDLDGMVDLGSASAASELAESAGVLAFLAKGGYPDEGGRQSIVPHAVWHLIEALTNINQFVVCKRPGGPSSSMDMSVEACELWTKWNQEMSQIAIYSKSSHYPNLADATFELMYLPFWADLPSLFEIMSRYCCLRGPAGRTTSVRLREQDLGMRRQWGPGGNCSLDRLSAELKRFKARL
ncbi:BQ5605_C013g07296 [Microbotryum silenes-dioicae]|uniref:BQ5605_C013g07296 protein n=1 Tax=Microbotryum silenes-dioicae TaxID=796604 RepID=A0A2X0MKV9_9BASI|nr:BQ5605_C013g07296 [Microbotryum silenes-dioicae]